MIAVLMASVKRGKSSWAAVRGRKTIHVTGMTAGDVIHISGLNADGTKCAIGVDADVLVEVPECCLKIMVEHIETSGNPIFVDLR